MKKIYLLFILLSLNTGITSAQCSMYPVSLAARVQQSTLIIKGKVIAHQSFWNSAKNYIYTSNLVDVEQVLKGELTTTQVEIITEGGEIALTKQKVDPSLQLASNEEGIFTLINYSTASQFEAPVYQAYGDAQGFIKFNLEDNTATAPFDQYKDINGDLKKELENLLGSTLNNLVPPISYGKYSTNTVASVTGFSPTVITAGTFSVLTITGTGFGSTQSTSKVEFKNADDGGATFITAEGSQYVSWSNTQIQVIVPTRASTVSGTAGTGQIRVTVAGSPTLSAQTLTVDYGELNVFYSGTNAVYNTRHVDLNGSAGVTWRMYTSFDANTAAKAAFLRSFSTWRCNTYINWLLGPTTTTNVVAFDGTDIIRFDIGTELPVGVLGRCTSYFNGCIVGPNVFWYVAELDICFDEPTTSAITWQFGPGNATGIQYDFETVSLHELGHGHQLSHVINTSDPMHYALANAQNKRNLIAQDIAAGVDVMTRNTSPGVCSFSAMAALNPTLCGATAPTASFTIPSSICAGQNLSLIDQSSGGPTIWSWTITGASPASSTQQTLNVTYPTAGVYTISLIAGNGIGSSTVTSTTITVVANPTVSVASASICSGTSTLLTASGATSYTWNPSALTGASQNLNPLTTTVYTINGANGSCAGSTTLTVNVVTSPTLSVNNAQICSGSSTLLTASGASSYTWNPGNLSGAAQNLNPVSTTVYTIDAANGSCFTSSTTTLTVVANPTLVASNGQICSGTTTLLTVSGASSYTWNPGNLSGASQNLNPSSSTIYTINGASGACLGSTTLNLTVLTSPTIAISNAQICSGTSTLMTASGATTYTWNPGNLSGASQNLNPLINTSYSVSGSIGSCTAITVMNVSVTTTPTLSAPNAFICAGSPTLLTATGATSYTWNPGNLSGASQNLNPVSSTVYTVNGANGNCVSTKTLNLTVQALPAIFTLASPTVVCAGNSANLLGGGASTYTWTNGAPGFSLTGSSVNVTPTVTTVYTVAASDGTCVNTTTLMVAANPNPTLSLSSGTICSGTSTFITATGANSYTWLPISLPGATQTLSPLANSIYTVIGTTLFNCVDTKTLSITVNTTPTLNITNGIICAGGSTLITVSGASTYTWNPGALSGASQNLSPSGTTVYTVTGTSNNCLNTKTLNLIVTPNPTLSVSNATICSGTSTLITAGGASTYTWNPGNLTGASQNLGPASTSIYTVSGTSSNCSNTKTLSITVNITPTLVTTNATVCAGSSVNVSVSGASSYTWNPGNLSGASQFLSPLTTTQYTISGSSLNCLNQTNLTITVNPVPNISVPNGTLCAGSTTIITATGANTYTWNTPIYSGGTATLNPLSTTIYSIIGSFNATGCSSSATSTLTVFQKPVMFSIAIPTVICSGSTSTLNVGGAASYTWNPSGLTGAGVIVSPNSSTTYTVNGFDGFCFNSTTVQVSVNATPTLSASNYSMCSGNSISMSASGATSIIWNPGNLSGNTVTVSPFNNTTYTLLGTSPANCTASALVNVSVAPSPTLQTVSSTSVPCYGYPVILTASGANSYTWIPTGATTASNVLTPTANIVYQLIGRSGACFASIQGTLIPNPNPTITVSASSPSICNGSTLNLNASGANLFTWIPGNLSGASVIVNPGSNQNYTVTGTYTSSGCSSTHTLNVQVIPLPSVIVNPSVVNLCVGESATLTANGAANYTWNPGNLSGANLVVSPLVTTIYTVTGETNGCAHDTTAKMNVSICENISKQSLGEGIRLYPNPFHDQLNLDFDMDYKGRIQVYNALGQVLQEQELDATKHVQLNLSQYAKGVYLVHLVSENQERVYFKVLKD